MERKRSVKRYGSRKLKKTFGQKCKDFIRAFIAFMFSNVGIIGLVVGYTIVGALMFQRIEVGAPNQNGTLTVTVPEIYINMSLERNKTTAILWNLILSHSDFHEGKWRNETTDVLKDYTIIVTNAYQLGFEGSNAISLEQQWKMTGAFLYSLTVITTIGYGNVSPQTAGGKIATIIYAIAGMPLFLLYLSNIGDILARCFKWLYAKCCLCNWCPNVAKKREERRKIKEQEYESPDDNHSLHEESQPGNYQRRHAMTTNMDAINLRELNPHDSYDEQDEGHSEISTNESFNQEYDPQTVTVPITICLTIMVGYVCGGAMLFQYFEKWDFLDGAYFCFISLSTIGFGDIVPGVKTYYREDEEVVNPAFILCSMYLMLGMALIAMCFNLMQEEVIHKIRTVVQSLKRIFR